MLAIKRKLPPTELPPPTIVSRLPNLPGAPHIGTSDLVREELASSGSLCKQLTEILNQGKLVSDEIIVSLLSKRLEAGEAKDESDLFLMVFLEPSIKSRYPLIVSEVAAGSS
ncbi:hypothetical protein V6N13_060026 [Hibiscus sabdariffa]|uniref:adenylate kinase n=1 Tax=Hibiscus sabdariffa TaxID=183260 RepID=A0ABR2GB89_9ROSI